MIVASHQPNFLPYMGYFYKMYVCDVFTLSDSVQFSRQGFHNYNFIETKNGEKSKVIVPVCNHSGAIKDVVLSQWGYNGKKIWRRLCQEYCHAPYFNELKGNFQWIFETDFKLLSELNIELISVIYDLFGFDCGLIEESDLNLTGSTATEQIAEICKRTGCNTYLSGTGAREYLDVPLLNEKGIAVKWSDYKPLDDTNLSVFDYLMKNGAVVPEEWRKQKERLHYV